MQFASTNSDLPLTEAEEAVLERLYELAGEVSLDEFVAWFGLPALDTWPAAHRGHAQRLLAVATSKDRLCVIGIAKLTVDERRVLERLVAQHPHTRFFGFDESPHLQRALELAALHACPA